MLKKILLLIFSILFFVVGCTNDKKIETRSITNQQAVGPKEFIIAGSGTNLPITGKLIQVYEKETGQEIKMPESIGSGGGIKALEKGAIEIALTSRPLKKEEKDKGLKELVYVRVALIIGTHTNVPDDNVSYNDLVEIFLGKKNQWKDGNKIIVLSRNAEDSTNQVLGNQVPGFKEALEDSIRDKRWDIVYSDTDAAEAISKTNNAIGFTDSGFLQVSNHSIKPLKVNGIEPTIENVTNGSYKLYKDLFLVYKAPLSKRGQEFIDFVFSEEGKKVISENGGYPLE